MRARYKTNFGEDLYELISLNRLKMRAHRVYDELADDDEL
jgi:hypothetical protein